MARRLILVAALVAVVLPVAGAGGAPDQAPKRGGTVVIASGEPACLNLFVGTSCQSFGFTLDLVLWQVLEGAFEVTPSLSYRPNLVTGVTVKRRPFTVTYHIRPEARWSDGTPVTASDFAFTFTTLVDPANEYALAVLYEPVRRVQAVDEKTFRVVFHRQVATWRDLFSAVLPRHVLAGRDFKAVWRDAIDDPRTGRPIGSGPFLVQSFERGKQLTVVRNPRYWGSHRSYLDRIVFRFLPASADQAAQVEALKKGTVDVIYPQVADPLALAALRHDPSVVVDTAPVLRFEHLVLRLRPPGHSALRDRRVRQALAYAIDREAIVRQLLRPLAPSMRPLDSVVFMGNSPHYRPNWDGYRRSPARARQLLQRAGCTRGPDGVYVCGGERLSLRLATTAGNVLRERAAQLVARQLRGIGVEVIPTYASPGVFFGSIVATGAFDLALYGLFAVVVGPTLFRCGDVESNASAYCSGRVTRDLLQAERAVRPRQRAALLNRADRQLAVDVPLLPLFQRPGFLAYRPGIHGIAENPSFDFFTWNNENWWVDD